MKNAARSACTALRSKQSRALLGECCHVARLEPRSPNESRGDFVEGRASVESVVEPPGGGGAAAAGASSPSLSPRGGGKRASSMRPFFFLSGRKIHSDWYSASGRRAPGQDGERAPGADGERPGRRRRLWRTAPILRPTNLRPYSVYLHAVAVQCNEACHLIRIVVVSGCWWAWMTLRRIEPLRVAKELFRERGPHVAQRLSLSRHHRIACETLRSSKIMLVFET